MAGKSHERRAIVIGGSMAGLFAGAFLRRIGWRVDIYERSSIELIGRGVGIFATHLELLEALDKCGGIETDEDRAFAKLLQSPKDILDWIAVPNFLNARP